MAQPTTSSDNMTGTNQTHQAETTFKNYSSTDAQKYTAYRATHNPRLVETVVRIHAETGGQMARILDVGCGPATATRQVASYFKHAVGVDASPAMIEQAQQIPCSTATGEQTQFQTSNAEEFDQLFEPGSIDLIIVAAAAHWFDMPRFYAAAAKVLKPSGSIAIWASSLWWVDPTTTPNAEAIMGKWNEFYENVMRPYEAPGNLLARGLYKDLLLPWTIGPDSVSPETAKSLASYDRDTSVRKEWNADGKPDPDPMLAETKGFMKHLKLTLDQAAKYMGTASPITRWREAHKEQLESGEVEDCIDRLFRLTKEELAKDDDWKDRDWVEVCVPSVLIVVKKA